MSDQSPQHESPNSSSRNPEAESTEQRSSVSELRAAQGDSASMRSSVVQVQTSDLVGQITSYLESSTKDCDERVKGGLEVRPCRCRSWFCSGCCVGRGLILRERLLEVVQTFTGLQMWTFTVDPLLFPTPAAAYEYLRNERCLARLIRSLRRQDVLHTPRFFCVAEWQTQTEMPHFHVLLDASFIEFDLVCREWNHFRPESAGPVVGDRPGFGAVRFSASKHRFQDPAHATNYACKYLIKHPEHGYPQWVLDRPGQIHRYSVSSGFWKSAPAAVERAINPGKSKDRVSRRQGKKERLRTTIGERVAICGQEVVVLAVRSEIAIGVPPRQSCEYVDRFPVPVDRIAIHLGRSSESNGRLPISVLELAKLRNAGFRQTKSASSPEGNHGS